MFFNRLKELRLERGLTQKDVAKAFGISVSTYRRFEKYGEFHAHNLRDLAMFYGVSCDYLVGNTDNPTPFTPHGWEKSDL